MSHFEVERYHGHFSVIDLGFGESELVPEIWADGLGSVVETIFGHGVRLSAPGYLDCTDWEVYATEQEADDAATKLQDELDEAQRGDDDAPPESYGVCRHGKAQHDYYPDCLVDY